MPITVQELGPAALEIGVRGRLERSDYARAVPVMEEMIDRHDEIGVLVHVGELRGWSPAALWEDVKFDVKHYRDLSRVALVGARDSRRWMAKLAKPFTAGEVRWFGEREVDAARAWVRASGPVEPAEATTTAAR
ncbi:MAG TPA: STAS/SEC14 domain-containing protein [Myxococcota bacterium]|nr:STAS/SEC14 domain-containing protein [Myxococcota bacterium]